MSDTTITNEGSKSGAVPEAVAGLAVIILAILGLAGVSPMFLVAIGTIVFGVELLLNGSSMMSGLGRVLGQEGEGDMLDGSAVNGLSTVFLAGVAGIVLGILALLDVSSAHLVAIAAIAFGGALLVSSNADMRIRMLETAARMHSRAGTELAEGVASDGAGMQTMSGLTAIVLGILALAGFASVTLVLVALLTMSGYAVLSSGFISNCLMRAFGVDGQHAHHHM
jgi:hypothetical protein